MKAFASRIILSGEPKSTQHVYRATCRGRFPTTYMTNDGKALKEAYQWEAKSQWKGKPLQGDISVSITLYFGTKRKADLDNFTSCPSIPSPALHMRTTVKLRSCISTVGTTSRGRGSS